MIDWRILLLSTSIVLALSFLIVFVLWLFENGYGLPIWIITGIGAIAGFYKVIWEAKNE